MRVSQITEVIWKYFQEGRPKATAQTIRQADIGEMVKLSFGNIITKRYEASIKNDKFGEPDYSFTSPLLDAQTFELSEPNTIGMRRADMGKFDLVRLPDNNHITNIYPIGGTCGSEEVGKISLVQNGQEHYFSSAKFRNFLFAVVVGRGLNCYNLPHCVTKLGIETTYSTDSADISLDMGFDISLAVLGILYKQKVFPVKILDNSYDPNAVDIKHRLQEQQ